jgi:hypothetical protein
MAIHLVNGVRLNTSREWEYKIYPRKKFTRKKLVKNIERYASNMIIGGGGGA